MDLFVSLRVEADETSSDITTGANFGVSGPTTGTTGGVINFYIARLGNSFLALVIVLLQAQCRDIEFQVILAI